MLRNFSVRLMGPKADAIGCAAVSATLLLACGSSSGDQNGQDMGGTVGAGGAVTTGGAGGAVGPSAGGAINNPGAGGAVNPGAGGAGADVGAGGTVTSGGAGGVVGTGGSMAAGGAGGVVGTGGTATTGGAGGVVGTGGTGGDSVTLIDCDQRGESSAAPVTDACKSVTTPTGTTVQLGPYGAAMDVNVGAGFENTDPNDNATCPGFVALFNEDAALSQQLLDVGPQPCNATAPNTGDCLDFKLYTVYRPANWPEGPIPVITWGNGTCAQPEGYGALLRYVASQGFFVIAANSREVGSGAEMLHALDYAAAANDDSASPYYGHLDMSKVGVMGHSQGGQGTVAAASDSRIHSAIIFNGGASASKPFLAISGDLDIVGIAPSEAQMQQAVNAAPQAAYLWYKNPEGNPADNLRGHLVLMLSPERVTDATANWWKMMFYDDPTARDYFVGSNCGLCNQSADFDYGQHGL